MSASVDHRQLLVSNIGRLIEENTGDVEVKVGGENGNEEGTFVVHGIIFAAISPVFKNLLYTNDDGTSDEHRGKKIVLPDISATSFGVIRQ